MNGAIMNITRFAATLLAVSSGAFAGHVLAESPGAVPEQRFVPTNTRAQVQAELAQFKQAGVNPWSASFNQLRGVKSTVSRDQVAAEYVGARDVVAAFTGEDSGSAYLAAHQLQQAPSLFAGQAPAAQ
jgi:hypothetical protein